MVASATTSPAQHFQEAVRLLQAGRHAEAAECCQRVLEAQPGHGGANYILGYQALESGNHDTAIKLMEKAIATGLRDPAALYHYGTALAKAGNYMDAARQFAQATFLKTDFTEARLNLANAYFELGAFPEAGDQYRQVIRQNPDSWTAHHNLAHVYYYLGEIDEAVRFFREATQGGSLQYAEAHASLACMLELNNQPEEAEQAARQALQLQSGNASAHITLAKCQRRKKQFAEALDTLDRIDLTTTNDHTGITLHNEYGQNLDRLGRYAEAYQAFTRSKTAQSAARRLNYDASHEFRFLDRAEDYFTQEKMYQLRQWITTSAPDIFSPASVPPRPVVPLFVTGFHRSGTTLAEQMLSSHPEIDAAGELDMLAELETRLAGEMTNLPAVLETLLAKQNVRPLLDLRQQYLEYLVKKAGNISAQDIPGKRWITDKSLFSMLHLPLIRLLFPDAAVIHVIRHPLDTLLSVYMQNFLWGNEWSMTMKDSAHAFSRTAQHVQRILPVLGGLRYLPVRYEALIAEPESHIRSMLALAGADYHSSCLDFHHNRRVARTASYEQVSRPIYQDSVRRYARYLPYIEPEVITGLHPVIESLHYTI